MSSITEYLNKISEECAKLGIDLDANMYPGIPPNQAAETLRNIHFDVPGEIIEIFMWKNGVRLEGQRREIRMFPRFYLRTLKETVHATQILSAPTEDVLLNEANWFSIFEDLAGDYLTVNVMPGDSDFGKIFSVEELVEPFPAFWSLEAMLRSVLECYRSGAYFIDEDGLLAEDEDTSDPIYRCLNNGLSPFYWKSKS